MGLFQFGKKKAVKESGNMETGRKDENIIDFKNIKNIKNIKVLGAGCKSCHEMYENTKAAVANMGLSVEVEYITDMEKIAEYGIMSMPGLLINDKPASVGKVLKTAEVENLLCDWEA